MSESTKQLLRSVLALPGIDRAALAQELLSSLDRPDAAIDEQWATEAEDRLATIQAAKMKAILPDVVISDRVGQPPRSAFQ